MNELKSKHSDLDLAFKSVLNVVDQSPCRKDSTPYKDAVLQDEPSNLTEII